METLPSEIIDVIISILPLRDVFSFSATCVFIKNVCLSNIQKDLEKIKKIQRFYKRKVHRRCRYHIEDMCHGTYLLYHTHIHRQSFKHPEHINPEKIFATHHKTCSAHRDGRLQWAISHHHIQSSLHYKKENVFYVACTYLELKGFYISNIKNKFCVGCRRLLRTDTQDIPPTHFINLPSNTGIGVYLCRKDCLLQFMSAHPNLASYWF